MKKAFTLIELLVVIAIIAILAAILFPVFAQAKAAAKASVAISNQKQVILGELMYSNDYDDMVPMQYYNTTPTTQIEWKELLQPYIKNVDIFRDPSNPAARYYDAETDPTLAALWGLTAPDSAHRYARGYAITNPFTYNNYNSNNFVISSAAQPANLMALVEWKEAWVEAGPYFGWTKNDPNPDNTNFNLGWNWGGGKWGDTAQAVAFYDGHAKRTNNHQMCGKDNEVNMWGYQRDQLAAAGYSWLDTFCQTIPQGL